MNTNQCSDRNTSSSTECSCCPPNSTNAVELKIILGSSFWFVAVFILEYFAGQRIAPWLILGLYLVAYIVAGASVFKTAWLELKKKNFFNEFMLMTVASITAIFLGEAREAVGLMLFFRVGEYFQEKAAGQSRASIEALLAARPTQARVIENGQTVMKKAAEVKLGQKLEISPGESIPLDGTILSGNSQMNLSPLTGESTPVDAGPGSQVFAGTLNLNALITIEVTKEFANTQMSRILNLVRDSAQHKAPTERFFTTFARYYTPAVFAAAILTAILPPLLFNADPQTWIYRSLVLILVSCPCALLISIPLGYFGGIGAASRSGLLIKGGGVLDGLKYITTVVFDKTGTLTKGIFAVESLYPAPGVAEEELLEAASWAESASNHPIARAIQKYAGNKYPRPDQMSVEEVPGNGMKATLDKDNEQTVIFAGRKDFLRSKGIEVPEVALPGGVAYVAKNNVYLGMIHVEDEIRPESAEVVADLKKRGLQVFMLTGDRREEATVVADKLNLDGWRAELLPEDKINELSKIASPDKIAAIGDGLNDAPMLSLCRIGVAMGDLGSQAAIEAADAVILNDSPRKFVELLNIADRTRKIVWQNISLSLGVKLVIMILGVSGLTGLWEAIFADVGVALLAILNSSRR